VNRLLQIGFTILYLIAATYLIASVPLRTTQLVSKRIPVVRVRVNAATLLAQLFCVAVASLLRLRKLLGCVTQGDDTPYGLLLGALLLGASRKAMTHPTATLLSAPKTGILRSASGK
jgi:hypothetical protein